MRIQVGLTRCMILYLHTGTKISISRYESWLRRAVQTQHEMRGVFCLEGDDTEVSSFSIILCSRLSVPNRGSLVSNSSRLAVHDSTDIVDSAVSLHGYR